MKVKFKEFIESNPELLEILKSKESGFDFIAELGMAYINEHFHPHVQILINPDSAVLNEGQLCHHADEYIVD